VRWINDVVANNLLLEAATCRYIDSRRYSTTLEAMSFDDSSTFTPEFGELVQELLSLSTDNQAHYMVLRPEPVTYFHHHFGLFPIVALKKGDTAETYLALLLEDPGGSPADAVGINCYEWVILPESHRWFAHCLRDSDSYGGHLWLPSTWIKQVTESRPWIDYPAQSRSISF
jgi:hypothetical protein